MINPKRECSVKQVMGNWSNERRFAALKNTAILGMLPFAVQSERDKRRMLRCWASTPHQLLLVCCALLPCNVRALGLGMVVMVVLPPLLW